MNKLLAGSAKYLELSGGLRNLEYLMLNIPFECNYRCTKCCNSGRSAFRGQPLSFVEIAPLIHEADDLGIRVLVIAGEGEPLMDEKLERIVETAYETGIIPYIFTNGSLLDNDTAKFIVEHNASLVINMDSLEEEKYETLTQKKGSFHTAMQNIETARRIFGGTYSTLGGYEVRRIAINMVVSAANANEPESLVKFCGDDFAFVLNTPMKAGRAKDNESFSTTPQIESQIAEISSDAVPLGTTSDGQWCAYMRNGISVGSDGEILLCAYSLEGSGIGNVRNGGLKPYIGRANAVVDGFYGKNGHSRCILRHQDYVKLVEAGD